MSFQKFCLSYCEISLDFLEDLVFIEFLTKIFIFYISKLPKSEISPVMSCCLVEIRKKLKISHMNIRPGPELNKKCRPPPM